MVNFSRVTLKVTLGVCLFGRVACNSKIGGRRVKPSETLGLCETSSTAVVTQRAKVQDPPVSCYTIPQSLSIHLFKQIQNIDSIESH